MMDLREALLGRRAASRMCLTRTQSLWFDAMRGLAAVAVLVYHIRYRFFADWSEVPHSASTLFFYTLTSFGHDAVMVFFVLSGALISRSVIRAGASGRWSWLEYAAARSSRLYVVLLPGLLLTLAWDMAGLTLFPGHPVYTGHATGAWHDFFDVRAHLGVDIFTGNALFLQAILVPTFGSNTPLWSLSFEFWYYVLFPMLCWAALPGTATTRVLCAVGALAAGALVGITVLEYFPLWLMGAGVWFLPMSRLVERHPEEILTAALVVLAATLLACHSALGSFPVVWRDYLIGGVFTAVVWVILHLRGESNQDGIASRAAKLLAGQSYTLYVVHVPLLVFLRAALGGPLQWQLSPATAAMAAGLGVLCLVYSYGIAQLTEARTELVRQRLRRWIIPVAPTGAVGIVGGGEGPA